MSNVPNNLLVSPERTEQIRKFCEKVCDALRRLTEEFGLEVYCSLDGNFLEVIDPTSELPEGYEYVATINCDDDIEFEVSTKMPEDIESEQESEQKELPTELL